MNDEQVTSIVVALTALGGRMDVVAARLDNMETARNLARIEQDSWKSEIRTELSAIKEQTTKTNGRLTTLEMWRERLGGAASVFSWWKPAVAAVAASGALGLVVYLTK